MSRRGFRFPRVCCRALLSCRWDFEHVQKIRASQNSRRVVGGGGGGGSNPPRTRLNLVSVNQKVREM